MRALYDSKSKTIDDRGIKALLSDEAKYNTWLMFESVLAQAQAELGFIPRSAADEIKEKALSWSLGRAEPHEIDELNILHATMLAMQRAVAGLHIVPEYVLIDGNRCPALPVPSMAVVKGDSRVAEISAASILAKVTRDAEMAALDTVFPQYGFAQHKGYPTAFHLEKLALHGATEHHRRSFGPVKRALGLSS